MPDLKLHIVAFDIPYPPDYGGAIDVFYKVKNLFEAGIKIYLHCPQYANRHPSKELEAYCEKVFYYQRKTGIDGISFRFPYMVYSRRNSLLLKNILEIEAPILFDGVSTSYYLSHPSLRERLKILRPQNVEQDYYYQLALRERKLFKKIYYFLEAKMLRIYENHLSAADAFFTVALHDHVFFKQKYPSAVHQYIPSFQPYNAIKSKTGKGSFCLYHGNLALAENKEAVLYLLREIVPYINYPFVVAGRNPDKEIQAAVQHIAHCKLIMNPSMEDMDQLINEAHLHVLPTFQNTGLKLKLLHALFNGRHIVVNDAMVHGTGLEGACHVCNNKQSMIEAIISLKDVAFDEQLIAQREKILLRHYNNRNNAAEIVTFLQQRSL